MLFFSKNCPVVLWIKDEIGYLLIQVQTLLRLDYGLFQGSNPLVVPLVCSFSFVVCSAFDEVFCVVIS